jgi:hypothetical protein
MQHAYTHSQIGVESTMASITTFFRNTPAARLHTLFARLGIALPEEQWQKENVVTALVGVVDTLPDGDRDRLLTVAERSRTSTSSRPPMSTT